jgi:hypothetical protein
LITFKFLYEIIISSSNIALPPLTRDNGSCKGR